MTITGGFRANIRRLVRVVMGQIQLTLSSLSVPRRGQYLRASPYEGRDFEASARHHPYNVDVGRALWRQYQRCRASVVHAVAAPPRAQHNFPVHIPRPCSISCAAAGESATMSHTHQGAVVRSQDHITHDQGHFNPRQTVSTMMSRVARTGRDQGMADQASLLVLDRHPVRWMLGPGSESLHNARCLRNLDAALVPCITAVEYRTEDAASVSIHTGAVNADRCKSARCWTTNST